MRVLSRLACEGNAVSGEITADRILAMTGRTRTIALVCLLIVLALIVPADSHQKTESDYEGEQCQDVPTVMPSSLGSPLPGFVAFCE